MTRRIIAMLLLCLTLPLAADEAGIVWFGTLEDGLKEAARTHKPILLMSAAPHCHNVPGIW